MRLLVPTVAANWSSVRSIVPAATKAARHFSTSSSTVCFRVFNSCLPRVPAGTLICTAWYMLSHGDAYELERECFPAFAGVDDLGPGHGLLRLYRGARAGNHGLQVLD